MSEADKPRRGPPRAGPPRARVEGPEWARVLEAEAALGALLTEARAQGAELDMLAFAKAYASLAEATATAVAASGQTSLRFEAVRKALDLRTKKRDLLDFLE